jgi:hypothetical protein
MQNHGLREGLEQEKWLRLGSLAEPTPANANNRGATNIRGRRRDVGRGTDRNGEDKREPEEQEGAMEQARGGENENVETQEVREATAEAILEIGREEQETEGRRNGERRRAHAEATRP